MHLTGRYLFFAGFYAIFNTVAIVPPLVPARDHACNFILVIDVILAELNEKPALPMKRAQE